MTPLVSQLSADKHTEWNHNLRGQTYSRSTGTKQHSVTQEQQFRLSDCALRLPTITHQRDHQSACKWALSAGCNNTGSITQSRTCPHMNMTSP